MITRAKISLAPHTLWAMLVLTGLLAMVTGRAAEPAKAPVLQLKVQATGDGADGVKLLFDDTGVTLQVTHRHGIGRAVLVLRDGDWPAHLRLRFVDFPRIEGCRAWPKDAQGKDLWKADQGELSQAVTKDGEALQVVIPALPPGTKELHLQWIDFYRD
jgi:hypothetical protein